MNLKPEIRVMRDGRVLLGKRMYAAMRRELCALAGERCEGEGCGKRTLLADGHCHHQAGRGGGRRDDRIKLPDGSRNLQWLCEDCHRGKHIPEKVVPAKPTPNELRELLGL